MAETQAVTFDKTKGLVYAQALESSIRSGWAEAPARTAKNKISRELQRMAKTREPLGTAFLTGDELREVLDAVSSVFDSSNGMFADGIVLEGEGRAVDIIRTTPYPPIGDLEPGGDFEFKR